MVGLGDWQAVKPTKGSVADADMEDANARRAAGPTGPPMKELRSFMLELNEPRFFGGGHNGRDAAKLFLGGVSFLGG